MRTRRSLFRTAAVVSMSASRAFADRDEFGHFAGTIKTEWRKDGRTMKLLSPVLYVAPDGTQWLAPAGAVVDGASIPQFAWSFIGGPFEGLYRDASIIHDVACDEKKRHWGAVHLAFYHAMMCRDVERWRAKVMYAAVYHFGPRWKLNPSDEIPKRLFASEADFYALAARIESGDRKTPPSATLTILKQRSTTSSSARIQVELLGGLISAGASFENVQEVTLENIRSPKP